MGALVKPSAWASRAGHPSKPGWSSRATSIEVPYSSAFGGIVASVRCGGDSAAVIADVPLAWVGASVALFGVSAQLRVQLALVVLAIGTAQVILLPGGVGAYDSLELEVANGPVSDSPLLRLSLVSWDAGSGFWDARFVALLEALERLSTWKRNG